jgi:hypothetical protein
MKTWWWWLKGVVYSRAKIASKLRNDIGRMGIMSIAEVSKDPLLLSADDLFAYVRNVTM